MLTILATSMAVWWHISAPLDPTTESNTSNAGPLVHGLVDLSGRKMRSIGWDLICFGQDFRILAPLQQNLFPDPDRPFRELGFIRLEQEVIESTTMVHATQCSSRYLHPEGSAERIGHQGCRLEIWQESAPGPVVSMAYIVASHHTLAGQFTYTCHVIHSG